MAIGFGAQGTKSGGSRQGLAPQNAGTFAIVGLLETKSEGEKDEASLGVLGSLVDSIFGCLANGPVGRIGKFNFVSVYPNDRHNMTSAAGRELSAIESYKDGQTLTHGLLDLRPFGGR